MNKENPNLQQQHNSKIGNSSSTFLDYNIKPNQRKVLSTSVSSFPHKFLRCITVISACFRIWMKMQNDECKKDVPVALISSLEAKIKMNLDAQVVEQIAEVKKAERKKPKSKEPNAKRAKVGKEKKVKDPNMPKRPPTAFFVFMLVKKLVRNGGI